MRIPLINKRMKRGSKSALRSKLRNMKDGLDLLQRLLSEHAPDDQSVLKLFGFLDDEIRQSLELLEGESMVNLKVAAIDAMNRRRRG